MRAFVVEIAWQLAGDPIACRADGTELVDVFDVAVRPNEFDIPARPVGHRPNRRAGKPSGHACIRLTAADRNAPAPREHANLNC